MNPSKKPKNQKAPGAPKRFKSSFILFFMDVQESIKKSIPPGTPSSAAEVSKRASRMWKLISAEERKHWDGEAAKEKIRYEKEKESYHGPWKVVKKRVKKDPTAPKRNSSAFLLYSVKKRKQLKQQHPTLKNTDISRLLGIEWRKASDIEKRPFIAREEEERKVYKSEMEKWKKEKEESLRSSSRNRSFSDEDQASSGLAKPGRRTEGSFRKKNGETDGVSPSSPSPNMQVNINRDVAKTNMRIDSVTKVEPQGPNENEKINFVPLQISSEEHFMEPSKGLISSPSALPKNFAGSTDDQERLPSISESDGSNGMKSSNLEDNDSLSSVQELNKDTVISNIAFDSSWNSSSSVKNASVMRRPGKLEGFKVPEDDYVMGMIIQSNSRPSTGLSVDNEESLEWQKWLEADSPQQIQPRTSHVSPLNLSPSGSVHDVNSNLVMKRNRNKNFDPIVASADSFALPTFTLARNEFPSSTVSGSIATYVVSPGRYGRDNRSLSPLPYQIKQWYPPRDYQGRYEYSSYRVPQTPQHIRSPYLTLGGDNRLIRNNEGMMDTTFAPVNEAQYQYLPTQFDQTGPLDDFDPNIFEK